MLLLPVGAGVSYNCLLSYTEIIAQTHVAGLLNIFHTLFTDVFYDCYSD
jgi:hypothetical protein